MFVFMVHTGLVNHLQSVIIFYTGLLVPFAIFFLTNFFRTIPDELIEAAAVEGAGPFTVLPARSSCRSPAAAASP